MEYRKVLFASLIGLAVSAMTVQACYIVGSVKCPNNVPGANVTVTATGGYSTTTDENGDYLIHVATPGTYDVCVDVSTLPKDTWLLGQECQSVTTAGETVEASWELGGPACVGGACWFTGGGALIDPDLQIPVAEIRTRGNNGKTPDIAFGGNVYPGCNPEAGDGGSWNHVDRNLKLHFHGTDIEVVRCGNVPGIEPGSESPVTPYNFIEFQGVGWLKGIKGNKTDMIVSFFARCEDRNEPGSKGAKVGALIDRYYLRVMDGNNVIFQIGEGDPPQTETDPDVIPVLITDGNFQLHNSSCDNPPVP